MCVCLCEDAVPSIISGYVQNFSGTQYIRVASRSMLSLMSCRDSARMSESTHQCVTRRRNKESNRKIERMDDAHLWMTIWGKMWGCHGNSCVFKSLWHVMEWACSQRFTAKPGRVLWEMKLEHTVYFSLHWMKEESSISDYRQHEREKLKARVYLQAEISTVWCLNI